MVSPATLLHISKVCPDIFFHCSPLHQIGISAKNILGLSSTPSHPNMVGSTQTLHCTTTDYVSMINEPRPSTPWNSSASPLSLVSNTTPRRPALVPQKTRGPEDTNIHQLHFHKAPHSARRQSLLACAEGKD
jgi:hypothetical protein